MRGLFRSERHSRELTCHPRTVIEAGLDHWVYRIAYSTFSLGFGKDIPPLRLVGVLKPPTTDIFFFLTVIWFSYLMCGPRSTWPTLLRALVNDSVLYFLMVLISHSLMVLYMMGYLSSV